MGGGGCKISKVTFIYYFVATAVDMLEDVATGSHPGGGLPAATRRNWKQASLVRRNAIALQNQNAVTWGDLGAGCGVMR